MESYFFVPASRLNKLSDIKKAGVNQIIIDFEDAILSSEIEIYFKQLNTMDNINSYWFRIPVRADFNEKLNLDYLEKFQNIGVEQVVLPKVKSAAELHEIIQVCSNLKFLVLIEHPRLLLEIKNVFMNEPNLSRSVFGIGMGSHDLMTFLNARHTKDQLDYPRKELLYIAKAYNLKAIDIASMNIFDKNSFIEEVQYGLDNGYDAKFLIHPNQIVWFDEQLKHNNTLILWAQNVLDHLPKNYNGESIVPFILNEEVIEKPHAIRALEIIRKHRHGK